MRKTNLQEGISKTKCRAEAVPAKANSLVSPSELYFLQMELSATDNFEKRALPSPQGKFFQLISHFGAALDRKLPGNGLAKAKALRPAQKFIGVPPKPLGSILRHRPYHAHHFRLPLRAKTFALTAGRSLCLIVTFAKRGLDWLESLFGKIGIEIADLRQISREALIRRL
jgi:hypothetical protein